MGAEVAIRCAAVQEMMFLMEEVRLMLLFFQGNALTMRLNGFGMNFLK